uniref:SURF6 domain-containing protein n=1 Tax=Panagrellus redivivus TaxID=6233 RepID=A0A7E4VHK1_PANRE
MTEEQLTKTLKKFEFLANVIPKEKWGFQPDLLEDLRESKQTIVEETVPKSVLKGLSLRQKIRLGHRLGPKTDTVLDIFNWAAKSDFADSGMPMIMTPIAKQPAKAVKKTAEQTEEEAKIAKILLAKGIKPRNGATSIGGPPAAKKAKVSETAIPVDASDDEEEANINDSDEEEVVGAEDSDEEMEVDGSDDDEVDDDESSSEVVEDDEEVMEVDESFEGEEEEPTPAPVKKQPVAKKTAVVPKVAPEVEESSEEEEEEEDESETEATAAEIPKVTPKQAAAEAESDADSDEDDEEADSNESLDGSADEEEEEEEPVAPSKAKNSQPSKPVTEAKPIKAEVKPKTETETEPTTEDFDFSLLKNSLDKPDKVDKKKKKSKTDKRDSFKGRDYKSLLKKVEGREERLEKVREKNPEAAAAMETNIKFKKALKQASGEKVKDNPELLKKGIKRKEKQKEVRSKKWKKRVNTVKKAQADRQAKRTANIQKRKDTKKEHKIKRAKKRVKA